jgi:hypothetical protein
MMMMMAVMRARRQGKDVFIDLDVVNKRDSLPKTTKTCVEACVRVLSLCQHALSLSLSLSLLPRVADLGEQKKIYIKVRKESENLPRKDLV